MQIAAPIRIGLAFLLLFPAVMQAQSDSPVSLGNFARQLRREKQVAAPVIIDNDNLSRIMDEVATHRFGVSPLFSWNGSGPTFQTTFPDGTCSLSFNANATALLTVPYVAEELPQDQITKLEGPASIDGDDLRISVYNGSNWNLEEVTVGLTVVRRVESNTASYVPAKLVPAAVDAPPPSGKPSDLTLLIHMKGPITPLTATVLHQKLPAALAPGQEWHWAIIQAKGIRPSPLLSPLGDQSSPQFP